RSRLGPRRFSSRERQQYFDFQSAAVDVRRADAPALPFHRPLRDRETEPAAAILALARLVRTEIWLEDARAVAAGHVRTRVDHAQSRLLLDAIEADAHGRIRRRVVDRIAHDVLDRA